MMLPIVLGTKKEKISYNGSINKRNHYSVEYKAKLILEVLWEEATVNEIAARYGVNPVMVSRWKAEFLERAAEVFKKEDPSAAENELAKEKERVALLERKIGQRSMRLAGLKKFDEILNRKRP